MFWFRKEGVVFFVWKEEDRKWKVIFVNFCKVDIWIFNYFFYDLCYIWDFWFFIVFGMLKIVWNVGVVVF